VPFRPSIPCAHLRGNRRGKADLEILFPALFQEKDFGRTLLL
jgi:hypothetical protein